MNSVILFGATGQQGTAIAEELSKQGYSLIAPVRSQRQVEALHRQGIDGRLTDFSVDSLSPIIEGAGKVVLQIPVVITPDEMVSFARKSLLAIKQAGSPHTVVSISSIVPPVNVGLAGPDARLTIKQLTHQLLPDAIVLSSTLYLENFSQAYRQAIEQGGVIPQALPAEIPVAYMSLADLATFVTAALVRPELGGRFFPIGGREAMTGSQLAEKLGQLLGRPIHYQAITPGQLTAYLTPMIGETTALQVSEMYAWEGTTGRSLLNPAVDSAQTSLGVTLQAFEEWARKAFL